MLLALKAAADRTPCAGQPKGAECWLELANQAGCYVWTPQFDPYKVAAWTGECSGSVAQERGTLEWTWDVGDTLYKEVKKAEEAETPSPPQFRAGTPALFRGEPTCAGQTNGASCWLELANPPGCYLWNPHLQVDETVTWTGECIEGMAQGTGTRKWVYDSGKKTSEGTGQLRSGKEHGQWVRRGSDGGEWEGSYVEGTRHGNWVWREADGDVHEGPIFERKVARPLGPALVGRGRLGRLHRGKQAARALGQAKEEWKRRGQVLCGGRDRREQCGSGSHERASCQRPDAWGLDLA